MMHASILYKQSMQIQSQQPTESIKGGDIPRPLYIVSKADS